MLPIGKVNDRKGKTNADPYTVEYTKGSRLLRFPRGWGAYCYDNPKRVLPGISCK